jgi:glycosyltransferase involved in cell wall biosynthesis
MKVLIGTYRKRAYVPQALESLWKFVAGITELVFIDDSACPETAEWLSGYGRVVEVGGRGYTVAMAAACREMAGEVCFWMEEDFTVTKPVDLEALAIALKERPHLAQISLLRGPWYPGEVEAGGVIQALPQYAFVEVDGIIEHTAYFTGNPSVWCSAASSYGWPQVELSERAKCDQMLALGYRFGIVPGVSLEHWGEHTGFGY